MHALPLLCCPLLRLFRKCNYLGWYMVNTFIILFFAGFAGASIYFRCVSTR